MDRTQDGSIVDRGARLIRNGYVAYTTEFHRLTRQAQARFESRDWPAVQRDGLKRLELYSRVTRAAVRALEHLFGPEARSKETWRALKAAHREWATGRRDADIAETFFNSITRRVFATVGVDPTIEFIATDVPAAPDAYPAHVTRVHRRRGTTAELVRDVLGSFPFGCGWEDLGRDSHLVAAALEAELGGREIHAIEVAREIFFRNKGAYVVGRLSAATPSGEEEEHTLALALLNEDGRVFVDAVLPTEDEASVVFSFARSYFLVETESPSELVGFLRAIMPRKPVAELYTAIGHNKHGKTEFYRALLAHLARSDDRFEIARGARGMVMIVFTLPSYDVVFKVIRETFEYPKATTRAEVMAKYGIVFRHDRAGRLVDAQEFEHLAFDRARFAPALLEELAAKAADTVEIGDASVVLHHLYTERRLIPLDIYLREAPPEAARLAVLDYGRVLRDLAATNIFPGDLLLKNFGVTRHARVVFYDYDELALLTDCHFRELPQTALDMEFSGEDPSFYVGERDIFPEEFLPFLGLPPPLRAIFVQAHGDLLKPRFWEQMQREHRAGRVPDILPYREVRRLPRPR